MPPRIETSINTRTVAVSCDDEPADASVAASLSPALASQVDATALTAVRTLDGLNTNLIERIADVFPRGSKHVSRLCAVSQTFRTDLADWALTDKLCARAGKPLAQAYVCDAFKQVIAQSVRLPQLLRADVLKAVLVHLPKYLHLPLARLDHLLSIQSLAELTFGREAL